jgi:hypothetical protein
MSIKATEFYGGPHDGLVLRLEEITRSCHLLRKRAGDKERLFALMPSLSDWERVIHGKLDKEGPFDSLYPYELERRGQGAVFLFRGQDEFADTFGEFYPSDDP